MLDLDLALRCDACHTRPAAVRLGAHVLCGPCAHQAIERAAPSPVSPHEQLASDAARVLVWARAGLDVSRPRCGWTWNRLDAAIELLVRQGMLIDRAEPNPVPDRLGRPRLRRIVELVGAQRSSTAPAN